MQVKLAGRDRVLPSSATTATMAGVIVSRGCEGAVLAEESLITGEPLSFSFTGYLVAQRGATFARD